MIVLVGGPCDGVEVDSAAVGRFVDIADDLGGEVDATYEIEPLLDARKNFIARYVAPEDPE